MRKRLGLLAILVVFTVVLSIICIKQEERIRLYEDEENEIYLILSLENRDVEIYPWYNEREHIFYFFLPSCVKDNKVYFDSLIQRSVILNGVLYNKRFLNWEQDEIYLIQIDDALFPVTFMKSENIPAFFIDTETGNMDLIHADKRHKEKGTLLVVEETGNIQYSGKLDRISGRGNTTWTNAYKKPYAIKLSKKYPLCGLDACKRWNLLALYFEHDRIHSKIAFDLANEIGLTSTPKCIWVDLYCEGEYKGLYLLTEDPTKDYKNNAGYLLERDKIARLQENTAYFETELAGYVFSFREPDSPSKEQQEKGFQFIQNLENLIFQRNDKYKEYIDLDSLARQYLIDKLFMNFDAMKVSAFYFVDEEEKKLYAGPLWDFDLSVGTIISDYEAPMNGYPNSMAEWYDVFYGDEDFRSILFSVYQDILPSMKRILEEDIDRFVNILAASVKMDQVLERYYATPDYSDSYEEWESYIKYLKFFLSKRLNYLCDLWEINGNTFEAPEGTGESHVVEFRTSDGESVSTQVIPDGEIIKFAPEIDKEIWEGWYFAGLSKLYDKIPIYEDVILYARPISGVVEK